MLLETKTDPTTEEGGCKKRSIGTDRTGGVKGVLTLLTEVVELYV